MNKYKYLKYKKKYINIGGSASENVNKLKQQLTLLNLLQTVNYVDEINEEELYNLSKSGAYSDVFAHTTNDNIILLKPKNMENKSLLINGNDINMLVYLNSQVDYNQNPYFSEFIGIYFKIETFYLIFNKYTSDLFDYLNKLCTTSNIDNSIKSQYITKIETRLNTLFQYLFSIYYVCFDISLENILINYNENLEIKNNEIVLHDLDTKTCFKHEHITLNETQIIYFYYQIIIFIRSFRIAQNYQSSIEHTCIFYYYIKLILTKKTDPIFNKLIDYMDDTKEDSEEYQYRKRCIKHLKNVLNIALAIDLSIYIKNICHVELSDLETAHYDSDLYS